MVKVKEIKHSDEEVSESSSDNQEYDSEEGNPFMDYAEEGEVDMDDMYDEEGESDLMDEEGESDMFDDDEDIEEEGEQEIDAIRDEQFNQESADRSDRSDQEEEDQFADLHKMSSEQYEKTRLD